MAKLTFMYIMYIICRDEQNSLSSGNSFLRRQRERWAAQLDAGLLSQLEFLPTCAAALVAATLIVPAGVSAAGPSSPPPELELPYTDVIEGPFVLTAGAGGGWYHDTRIFNGKAYDVDGAAAGSTGLRVIFEGIDFSGMRFNFVPDADNVEDWHFNRWEGGVQLGVCTANNTGPPPPRRNVAMGPHLRNSAGMIIYANPSPNQGGDAWWSPRPPGSPWSGGDPSGSGYDARPGHGGVVNYAGKGFYVFPNAPATDPLEGGLVFTGEYQGQASNHWYRKDSLVPHTEWLSGAAPTAEETRAANTFDVVIDYTPTIVDGRDGYKRYRVEWWYRKHLSAARLEGGPPGWVPDRRDAGGGWLQPKIKSWHMGGYVADGTLTGIDEPGFDFWQVFPYVGAFGWWRGDQPDQTLTLQRIVVEYISPRTSH